MADSQFTGGELAELAHLAARDAGGAFLPGDALEDMRRLLDRVAGGDTDAPFLLAGYLRSALDRAAAEQQ